MGGTVVFVLKGYPRLSETFVAQEILGLERQGLDIRIVSLRRPRDATVHPIHRETKAPVSYLPEYLHDAPFRVASSWWKVRRRPGYGAAFARWLRDLRRDFTRNRIRRFGQALVLAAELPEAVDGLHAHFIHTPASVAVYASAIAELPWTCSAHARDIWTSPDWELEEKLADAEWVSVCTRHGAERLRSLSPFPNKVRLVYHGLDLERFAKSPGRARGADGTDAAAPVRMITVGRAVKKKGLDTLLEALALLPTDLHWRWTHIGDGELLSQLKRQATTLNLDDRISWKGALPQTDVVAQYREADMFVLPCRIASDGDRDGMPNVLMEAQSQALTCVSTPISGVPELILENETGVLVPPDDPRALADALIELCGKPSLRERLGRAAESRVHAEFGHEDGIRALMKLFAEGLPDTDDAPPETPDGTRREPSRDAA